MTEPSLSVPLPDWSQALVEGATLVTVNQRLARDYLQRHDEALSERGDHWWETADVLPWQGFVDRLHDDAIAIGLSTRARVSPWLERQRWRQTIEADRHVLLLDPESTARETIRARQTACQWLSDVPDEDYLSADQLAFRRWQSRTVSGFERDALVDTAALPHHLLEVFDEIEGSAADVSLRLPTRLLLAGFQQLTPQQDRLLERLVQARVPVEQIESDGLLSPLSSIAEQDPVVNIDSSRCRLVVASSDRDELHQVASMLFDELEADASRRIGVVVDGLAESRNEVLQIFDRVFFPLESPTAIDALGRPYELSIGEPLSEQPVVRQALRLLRLIVSRIESGDISACLQSPYLPGNDAEREARSRLDVALREAGIDRLDLDCLIDRLEAVAQWRQALIDTSRRLDVEPASPHHWWRRFSDYLQTLGWPGSGIGSVEYQAIQAWHDCLDELDALDEERLSGQEAIDLVWRVVSERVFQIESTQAPIRILGRLESHGIPFDHLWITGLDAERWPPVSTPTPFLSMRRQREAGVPDASPALRLAASRREFRNWQACASRLTLSRATRRNGAALAAASLWPTDLAVEPSIRQSADQNVLSLAARLQQALTPIAIDDASGPAVAPGSALRGGSRLFENQALCPFRAFALHRLDVRALEEPVAGMDPRQRGTLVHAALEHFWRSLRSQAALVELDEPALATRVRDAVALAMESAQAPDALYALEARRVELLLAEWIEQFEQPRAPFTVEALEQEVEFEHGGIRVRLQLDRLDEVEGRRLVLDYKTGTRTSIASWADERITSPQLPLYVLTDDSIDGACLAQIARHQCGLRGVTRDDGLLPGVKSTLGDLENWEAIRQHWTGALDRISAEIRSGLATVTPADGACDFCELKPLCRIDAVETGSA